MLASTLPCVKTIPLGSPVVPGVRRICNEFSFKESPETAPNSVAGGSPLQNSRRPALRAAVHRSPPIAWPEATASPRTAPGLRLYSCPRHKFAGSEICPAAPPAHRAASIREMPQGHSALFSPQIRTRSPSRPPRASSSAATRPASLANPRHTSSRAAGFPGSAPPRYRGRDCENRRSVRQGDRAFWRPATASSFPAPRKARQQRVNRKCSWLIRQSGRLMALEFSI